MKIKAARNSIETDSSDKENTAVNANTAAGEEKTFLGTEPIGRLLFKLAVPTVIAQLVNMLYNIVDRIYIGHMPGDGSAALTGVGVCMPLILIVSAFAAFVASGGAPRASISMGKGDYDSAEKILGGCVLMQVVISAALTVVLLVFGRDLLLAFGASENTIDYAADYMSIYAIGTLFVQLTLGLNAFITAQGFAKYGMLTVLIGAAANIVLDPIFIFGFKMGVRGAALATVISQGISCIWVILFLRGGKTVFQDDIGLLQGRHGQSDGIILLLKAGQLLPLLRELVGQIAAAVLWMKTTAVLAYLPYLLLMSVPLGLVTGLVCAVVLTHMKKIDLHA